jgi:acyl carrier protein
MRERIKQVLKNILDIPAIPDDISSETCMEWDSLHHFQLVVELEIEFGISFEPDDISEIKSLDAIEKKLTELMA